jgi:hypothetical protein
MSHWDKDATTLSRGTQGFIGKVQRECGSLRSAQDVMARYLHAAFWQSSPARGIRGAYGALISQAPEP